MSLESTFLTVSGDTLLQPVTIVVDRKASRFTHTLTWTSGSYNGTICTKSTSTSWTHSFSLNLANGAPNGTRVYCGLTLKTYDGDSLVGSDTYSLYLNIPTSVKPSCTVTAIDESGHVSIFGGYVQNVSKIKIRISAMNAYSSTIKSYRHKCLCDGNHVSSGYSTTSGTFSGIVSAYSGTVSIEATVSDSRGRISDARTTSVEVLPYTKPKISSIAVRRCDENGNEIANGSYCKATLLYSVSALNDNNTVAASIFYTKSGESESTEIELSPTAYTGSESTIFPADDDSSYEVKAVVTDSLFSSESTVPLSTAFTLMHFSANGKGLTLGKVADRDGFDVAMDAHFEKGLTMDIPVKNSVDCNQLKTSGEYYIGVDGTNKPGIGLNGWLTVRSFGTNKEHVYQEYKTYTGLKYNRMTASDGSGTWGDWIREPMIQTGSLMISPKANTATSTTVTFPIAFPEAPVVTATAITTVPNTVREVTVNNITSTTVEIYVYRTNTTNTYINWVAVY